MPNTSYFFLPNVSLLGRGALNHIGEQAARFHTNHFLLVTDKFLAATELPNRIRKLLGIEQIDMVLYDGVEPNPTLASVNAAYELYCQTGCGGIISLGGGSAHDCAKAVGILATNPAPLARYVGVNQFPNESAPVITVNTTAGTASEITNCFLITDTDTNVKLIFEGVNALANVAIDDPELMLTLPKGLTAATGMDALTHAIECYVSNLSFKLTNELALIAIRYIFRSLATAVQEPGNLEARDDMVYGQYMAGMAFGNGGVGIVHAAAHALGGTYNLPHGLCNAILLPHVMRFNMKASAKRYAHMYYTIHPDTAAALSDEDAANAFIKAVEELSAAIGTKIPLHELGVQECDFELLADKALKDSCCETNPIFPAKNDIILILKAAF